MWLPDAASWCSSLSSASSRCFSLAHLPAGSVFPMALRTGTSDRSCSPVLVCIFPMALCHGASPCGQHLPDGYPPQCCQSLRHGAPTSIFPMTLRHGGASHKALRNGAPASNKPHPAEKSTPVWLAIWHIWAGFANSQLQCATFHSTYSYKFTSSLLPTCNRCSDIANLSAHLHRLPTPPPYLRRMRLPLGRWRRSCKSPRAPILVLGTSGAHWPARWPQFELTERVAKS